MYAELIEVLLWLIKSVGLIKLFVKGELTNTSDMFIYIYID